MTVGVKPFVLTPGEPAGIGPDCVLLAYQARPELFRNVVVIAKPCWLTGRAAELGLDVCVSDCDASLRKDTRQNVLWVFDPTHDEARKVIAGSPSALEAKAVVACIRAAAEMCLRGQALGLITAPIEKAILKDGGFDFPGHTEFLADIAGVNRVVMMLASSAVRVALLTTHVAIRDVASLLNQEDTKAIIRIIHQAMRQQMGIKQPRLALAGLNPHAGEQGYFGSEEIDVLQPAIAALKDEGIMVDGPLPADTLFSADTRKRYDVIVCCYHDQALIPIKALSFGDAVNITLGLPFIRTSVDHGTAFSRAGTGNISYTSLITAIEMAQDMQRSGHD